jgi:hypothetical protein
MLGRAPSLDHRHFLFHIYPLSTFLLFFHRVVQLYETWRLVHMRPVWYIEQTKVQQEHCFDGFHRRGVQWKVFMLFTEAYHVAMLWRQLDEELSLGVALVKKTRDVERSSASRCEASSRCTFVIGTVVASRWSVFRCSHLANWMHPHINLWIVIYIPVPEGTICACIVLGGNRPASLLCIFTTIAVPSCLNLREILPSVECHKTAWM